MFYLINHKTLVEIIDLITYLNKKDEGFIEPLISQNKSFFKLLLRIEIDLDT